MKSLLPALAILVLDIVGCSTTVTQPLESGLAPPPSAPQPDVAGSLGTLRTRDRDVALFASSTGLKFTVRGRDGTVLADRVDLATLRTIDPQLYELCRSGVATHGPYLDATLYQRAQETGVGRPTGAKTRLGHH